MEKLTIIPTFNEKENIVNILEAIFQLNQNFDVLVVDDSSPDGTATLVKNLQQKYPNQLFLEERKGKAGLGTAYIHGFKWALANGYEYIFEMDADFSHNPNDLIKLYDACKNNGAAVAIGSRYVKGGAVLNWPWDRHLLSRGASIYTKLITRMPVNDSTAGFVCYKKEVLQAINFDSLKFVGYAFQIEMKFRAWKLGFKIKEVPIIFKDRFCGSSKMNRSIIKEGVLGVLKLKLDSLLKKHPHEVKNSSSSVQSTSN